jgi:hypothetical protein
MLPIIGFDAEWFEDPDDPTRNIILSYQYAVRADGAEWRGILYTRPAIKILRPDTPEAELRRTRERYTFGQVMARAISTGIKGGKIRKWPKTVIAAAHFTRSDLSAMADFAKFKNSFAGVHKTYVSFKGQEYSTRVMDNGHKHKLKVILVDTMLISPGADRSLKTLAKNYGEVEKLNLGNAPDGSRYIEHMDRLLADDPVLFADYAIRDAEICAKHVAAMVEFVNDDLGLGMKTPPVTIGSIGVRYAMKMWEEAGISLDEMNGVISRKMEPVFNPNSRQNPKARKYITREIAKRHSCYIRYEGLVKECYMGGRNECFAYGPTANMQHPRGSVYAPINDSPVTFREFDLKAAYATAMLSLQLPDYDAARHADNPADFKPDQLGFALVRFQFPPSTRFPCLPVNSDREHGLIYPMSGETYVTAPEIALALHLGAKIEIIDGVIVPWKVDSPRPYALAITKFSERRAKHPPDTMQNALYKLLGNSLYGKIGQGLTEKAAFDTHDEAMVQIPPSKVTNPFLVAHVTGLVRALVSEFIASIHDRWTVLYLSTDGFITNCPLAEISMAGPVAQHLSQVRTSLDGPALFEPKDVVDQLIPWRTRGVATLQTHANGKPKLAMAGMRAPDGVTDRNAWFVESMLTRKHGDTYLSSEPLSFSDAHKTNADFTHRSVEKRVNFEYDFKRRPVDPMEIDTHGHRHLTLATVPWNTVGEFNATRAEFERWRQQGGTLKTLADWQRWEEFQAGADAAKVGVHRRVKGGLIGQALRIFRRAYAKRRWGLPGGGYKAAAQALTAAGYPTKEQDFKDAARSFENLPKHAIPAVGRGVRELVAALVDRWPELEWENLVRDPWEGYLNREDLPARFALDSAGETPLRAAENLESGKLEHEPHVKPLHFSHFCPLDGPCSVCSPLSHTTEKRTPEEVAENDALCDWLFGSGEPPGHQLAMAKKLTKWPWEFRFPGNAEPAMARLPKPLSFAAMLRENEGEGVLLTELVCQSDWGPTHRQPQPAVH